MHFVDLQDPIYIALLFLYILLRISMDSLLVRRFIPDFLALLIAILPQGWRLFLVWRHKPWIITPAIMTLTGDLGTLPILLVSLPFHAYCYLVPSVIVCYFILQSSKIGDHTYQTGGEWIKASYGLSCG